MNGEKECIESCSFLLDCNEWTVKIRTSIIYVNSEIDCQRISKITVFINCMFLKIQPFCLWTVLNNTIRSTRMQNHLQILCSNFQNICMITWTILDQKKMG